MTLWPALDCPRVLVAFALLYMALPLLTHRGIPDITDRLVLGFVESVFVMQTALLILGDWGIAYPGVIGVIYLGWVLVRGRGLAGVAECFDIDRWRRALPDLLLRLDRREWRLPLRTMLISRESARVATFALVILAVQMQFPLFNMRFLLDNTYQRALSLQTLTHNAGWDGDGSVAFLAPITWLSGTDAAATVRWTGPLLTVLLALAVGYVAWTYTMNRRTGIAAIALGAAAERWWASPVAGELEAAEIATVFWLLSLGLFRRHKSWAVGSGLVAATMSLEFPGLLWISTGVVAALVFGQWLLGFLPGPVRKLTAVAATGLAVLFGFAFVPSSAVSADGPHQYESAARAVDRIARTFPRHQWVMVSPSHEVPLLYGRGWHIELADFVSSLPEDEVKRPDFRLPYTAPDIFVLVEKRPLEREPIRMPGAVGTAAYAYGTKAGREELEFAAGRLAANYFMSHPGSSIYYDDKNVTIYHFKNQP